MSMNITGDGTVSLERIPFEPIKDSISTAVGRLQSPIREMTKVADVKTAELRGESVTVSDEQVVKAIEKAIRAIQGKTTSLQFTVHEKTNMIAVKVLDADTGEVIREIPPEKTLDFVAKLWEMAGILIDERM
jgi:flagellar protein FlaG